MDVLTNIDLLLMNNPYFDLLFNINQLASPYQKYYQITHMEIDPLFTLRLVPIQEEPITVEQPALTPTNEEDNIGAMYSQQWI